MFDHVLDFVDITLNSKKRVWAPFERAANATGQGQRDVERIRSSVASLWCLVSKGLDLED